MDQRDLLVTPLFLMIVYFVAYLIRERVTDQNTKPYFIPALTVKIVGALAVGLIYQYYYKGGDTFTYHTYGSRFIWEAFMDSPAKGLKLLFYDGSDETQIYKYSSRILFLRDPSSYAIVKIAAVVDLFTLSTYSATAIAFALFSFTGMWLFFLTFYQRYPELHRSIAVASFFIPSVFFWGSGLLKDTITLGCLGMATFFVHELFIKYKITIVRIVLLLLVLYGLYAIKVYILMTFLPAAIVWVFLSNLASIKSVAIRVLAFPFCLSIAVAFGYYAIVAAGASNEKYSLSKIGKTAQTTAYDIRYWTGRDAGSGYTLGELDGSFQSMLAIAPQAVVVSFFRPFLWEVRNPLMLLSALESSSLMVFCLYLLLQINSRVFATLLKVDIIYTLLFAIVFGFAVGASTFNFGTLVRYKIPMLPFLLLSLILIQYYAKRERKVEVLEFTE